MRRQIHASKGRDANAREKQVPKSLIPRCREKLLLRDKVPVPQTDTGRQEENSKMIERTIAKELGKMTP